MTEVIEPGDLVQNKKNLKLAYCSKIQAHAGHFSPTKVVLCYLPDIYYTTDLRINLTIVRKGSKK